MDKMHNVNRFTTLTVVIIALFLGQLNNADASSYTADQPIAQIKATVDRAVILLNDKSLQGADRYDVRQKRLFELVNNRFDFLLMGRLALGKAWATVSEEQQQRFVDLFSELLKNTYIRRVNSYSGEKIIFTKQIIRNNLAMIYSSYEKNNDHFSIKYKMKKNHNGDWLVYDVVIEGVSVVKQYRKQFGQIIQKESMAALIKRLDDKVEALVQAAKRTVSKT